MVDPNKLKQLAETVIRLVGKEEFFDKGIVKIYSKTLDQSQYTEDVLEAMNRAMGTMSIFMDNPVMNLNADSIYESLNYLDICNSRLLNLTVGAVYVILHELGHWVDNNNRGTLSEKYPNVDTIRYWLTMMDFTDAGHDGVKRFLMQEEHKADYFAALHLNYVLDKLEEIDPNLLTYLD